MIRIITLFSLLLMSAFAADVTSGYLAVSEGGDRDPAVVEFNEPQNREYFDGRFLAEAPHTKTLASASTSIKATWKLIGYMNGSAIYDLVHTIKAYGGDWAVKTILLESESGLYRPLFSRATQPMQWPVTDTLFSVTDGSLSLVDRYRENAKISGPYGHVIVAKKTGWIAEDFTKHPQLFKNE